MVEWSISKISNHNKQAIVITDGDPDDEEVTAIIIINPEDYPIYQEVAYECKYLSNTLKKLTTHNINFEIITRIDTEYGFHYW